MRLLQLTDIPSHSEITSLWSKYHKGNIGAAANKKLFLEDVVEQETVFIDTESDSD